MRKYNELWRDLHNAATDDDFKKLRDSFRAGPGEVQLGLTVHDIDTCPNMSELRKILADKGIISEERNDFETLKTHMKECGLVKLAQIVDSHLQKHRNSEEGVSTDGDRSGITRTTGQTGNEPLMGLNDSKSVGPKRFDIECHRHRDQNQECYKFNEGSKRGLVLIINQFTVNRTGTEKDESDIVDLFENELKYEVIKAQDQSRDAALKKIDEMKTKLEEGSYDSFILFILSHGDEEGIMTVEKTPVDGKKEETVCARLTIAELEEKLTCSKLRSMTGKPKMILVQACRGRKDMLEATEKDSECATDEIHDEMPLSIPDEADFLTAYSQRINYYSLRDRNQGTWFIQKFVEVLKENKHRHVSDILTTVNRRVAEHRTAKGDKQMPVFMSSLRKLFYFVKPTE
ncbi:caspase-3-like isoform X1 [Tubulanus polymorphus]|uniref:caspase-3-like isoform X1 n=1 Tax=Tubulanus polymorphus TaxID=672921 RepID=UPI003DA51DEC